MPDISCEETDGKMKCHKCKYYHCYYGCMKVLYDGKGFVQIATKPESNFVQNDYNQTIDK